MNNTQLRITDSAGAERSRERLARLGPKSLSNAELPAIFIWVVVKGENAVLVTQQRYSGGEGMRSRSAGRLGYRG